MRSSPVYVLQSAVAPLTLYTLAVAIAALLFGVGAVAWVSVAWIVLVAVYVAGSLALRPRR